MGTLYIIATPIGNIEDITLRAIRILKEVDYILCEDTRVTRKLLSHYDIRKKNLLVVNDKSEFRVLDKIVSLLYKGKKLALVSDAGTPLISDPGYVLVKRVREEGFEIVAIPGPSSLTAALSIAGLPVIPFTFFGFPPKKKSKLDKILRVVKSLNHTSVFFVSPYRLVDFLERVKNLNGEREIVLVKEVTKKFETVISGNVEKVVEELKNSDIKGEWVVLVGASR